MSRKSLLARAVTALATVGLAVLFCQRAASNLAHVDYRNSNFFVFWLAGHMVDSGQNPYDAVQWAAGQDAYDVTWRPNQTFLYPLPLALLLAPLGLLPLPTAYVAWQILSEVLFAVVIWFLLRKATEMRFRNLFFPLAVFLLFFGPVYLTLQLGALGAFTLFFILAAIAAWDAGVPFLAGVLLSLTMLKPSQGATILALCGVWLLARRDWKALAGVIFGIAAVVAIGMLADPLWVTQFAGSSMTLLEDTLGRQSNLLSFAYLMCGQGPACTWLLGGAASCLVLALGGILLWRARPSFSPWEAFNIIIPLAFMSSIYLWSYDQILYVIPAVWISVALLEKTKTYVAPFLFALLLVIVSMILLLWQATLQTDVWSILTTAIVFGSCVLLGFRSGSAAGEAA